MATPITGHDPRYERGRLALAINATPPMGRKIGRPAKITTFC